MSELSYFDSRLQSLGISDQDNVINLLQYDAGSGQNILKPVPIFRKNEKGIEIIVYTLDRTTIQIEKDGSRWKKPWSIIRLESPMVRPDGSAMKYKLPASAGSFPFFPPSLVEKFEKKTPIKTLFLTEGFFKSFKGAMHGIDVVGLVSITHLKSKATGALHEDVLRLINVCKVEKVVWLTDGDVFDLSHKAADPKEIVDLYKRPSQFFGSISTFKALLDDYDVEKWFCHIDVDTIVQENKDLNRNQVKGLDDLLVTMPEKATEISEDLISVSKPGTYFRKYNITVGTSKVYAEFRLKNVTEFFLWHVERGEISKDRIFIFNGTKYQYDEEKGECKIMVPGDANMYCRVRTDYYKFVHVPNKYEQLERQLVIWTKSTVIDDHGKDFLKHIPKYQEFCNVPNHINYQQVVNGCFNLYSPLDYKPTEEMATSDDCKTILSFIHHIFGDQKGKMKHPETKQEVEFSMMEMALDYIQLLYQKPQEKLPILCLVSKENNTGKSTFGKLLKQILGNNCAIVGNQDLAGEFNKHWASRCLVICDETKIDKQSVIEKVKSLSTAERIMVNAKGKDQVELDCFIKFIFITNNEENFINLSTDDIRYWIIKVPTLKKEHPGIMDDMIDEIPAFLSYLDQRKLTTEKMGRMWFHPSLLKTKALQRVIDFSRSTIEKEIIQYMRDAFFDFGVTEIKMTLQDVANDVLRNRFEKNYVSNVLRDKFGLETIHNFEFDGRKFDTLELALKFAQESRGMEELEALGKIQKKQTQTRYAFPYYMEFKEIGKAPELRKMMKSGNGRTYVFRRDYFLTKEEIESVSVDPEQNFINQMTDGEQIPDQSQKGFIPAANLPFP